MDEAEAVTSGGKDGVGVVALSQKSRFASLQHGGINQDNAGRAQGSSAAVATESNELFLNFGGRLSRENE